MKIHVDKLNSRIETDNPDLLRALYELYSFKIPGSEYSTAYKRRQWDGKTHFISKAGVFRSGLLSRLLVDLEKVKCEPEILYNNDQSSYKYNKDFKLPQFDYYDYQQELIELGLENKRGIIKSPTGSGKTLAFLLPILEKSDAQLDEIQCLIMVPSRELAIQIEQVTRNMGSGFKVNAIYGGRTGAKDKLELKHRPAILIGTPGRIASHFRKESFDNQN